MNNELLKKIAEKTNKKTIKLTAMEVFELQVCATVLDFIDENGIDELRNKVNNFLGNQK